jgi:hypothetical protein
VVVYFDKIFKTRAGICSVAERAKLDKLLDYKACKIVKLQGL